MAGIDLANVSKSFGETEVLRDINLSIADGEFVVFVGPSGCGKSTLLRAIAGLEEVSAGTIRIGGADVTHAAPAKRGVAMVFQSYALYPHMTVAENMGFGLKLAGTPRHEVAEAVHSAARILRIEQLLDRKPRALSGGQRQRVAIGRAIVRKPGVFLFDEPLSNLDAGLRVSMRYEFAKLHDDLKTTMIYVTHDQVEAMTLADRIVVLSAGRIEQVGAPMELYQRPANTFVAGFIGSPTMNFIPGTVVARSEDGLRVQLATGEAVVADVEPGGAQPGDRVTLGIRPERFDVGLERNSITAKVRFVEQLGNATFAYATLPGTGTEITVQLAGDAKVHAGDTLRLGVPPSALHVFDASGRAFVRR